MVIELLCVILSRVKMRALFIRTRNYVFLHNCIENEQARWNPQKE